MHVDAPFLISLKKRGPLSGSEYIRNGGQLQEVEGKTFSDKRGNKISKKQGIDSCTRRRICSEMRREILKMSK